MLRNYEAFHTLKNRRITSHTTKDRPYSRQAVRVGQSGVFGLLDEERMTIKPEGFDHLHTRGGGLHRLREDNSKWKPLGIGGGEDKEED